MNRFEKFSAQLADMWLSILNDPAHEMFGHLIGFTVCPLGGHPNSAAFYPQAEHAADVWRIAKGEAAAFIAGYECTRYLPSACASKTNGYLRYYRLGRAYRAKFQEAW